MRHKVRNEVLLRISRLNRALNYPHWASLRPFPKKKSTAGRMTGAIVKYIDINDHRDEPTSIFFFIFVIVPPHPLGDWSLLFSTMPGMSIVVIILVWVINDEIIVTDNRTILSSNKSWCEVVTKLFDWLYNFTPYSFALPLRRMGLPGIS